MDITGLLGYAAVIIPAYLAGAIPFGALLTALFAGQNIREKGSGNIGAANVARVAGLRLGLLTLALDMVKGAGPVCLAGLFGPGLPETSMTMAALAAFAGHLYPVYNGFKGGGKGIATTCGCFLVMAPVACLASAAIFALVVCLTRRVSAGSLAAAAALPPAVWMAVSSGCFLAAACIISLFVIIRHRENIIRLARGTEPAFFGRQDKKSGRK